MGATKENKSLLRNIAAGTLSGALAAWAANPLDLVKTRMQSKDNPHKSSTAVIRSVVQEQGLKGLWVGTVPAVVGLDLLVSLFSLAMPVHSTI